MKKKLQLAIDTLTIQEALTLVEQVRPCIDLIEAGTPFIKRFGLEVLARFGQVAPDKLLVADMKVMDAGASEPGTWGNQRTASPAVATEPAPNESNRGAHALDEGGMSSLDRRRLELERGTGGDHDVPYTFALPPSMPHVLAWMRLLARVHSGELEP